MLDPYVGRLDQIIVAKFYNEFVAGQFGLEEVEGQLKFTFWNVPGVPMPDINSFIGKEGDKDIADHYTKVDARQARREEYPAIGDQLDMLYKAMDTGILPIVPDFYNSIKAVKLKYPLEKV